MQIRHHGGSCCGIKHLFDFDTSNVVEDKVGLIKEVIDDWFNANGRDAENNGRIIEATLTDVQLELTPSWGPALRYFGFVPVARFLNSNSDNMVNVFHYHPEGDVTMELDDVPSWDIVYIPPAIRLPVLVRQEFVNVYNSGPGVRRFATLAESNVPRSAARRIGVNRLDTYENGTVVTTPLDNA